MFIFMHNFIKFSFIKNSIIYIMYIRFLNDIIITNTILFVIFCKIPRKIYKA